MNLCDKGAVKTNPRGIPVWAWGAMVVLLVLIVFLPAVQFPFFPFWDDDIHVHANPHLAHLSWSSVGALWAGPWQQLYIPLAYSVWAGLAALSRWAGGLPVADGALNAAWFHGANVVMHAVAAVLASCLRRGRTNLLLRRLGVRSVVFFWCPKYHERNLQEFR